MTDSKGEERKIETCAFHQSMDRSVIELTMTMAGLTQASNRVFMVGLALICLAIGAIFYAGQINQKVMTLERDVNGLKAYVYPRSYLNSEGHSRSSHEGE